MLVHSSQRWLQIRRPLGVRVVCGVSKLSVSLLKRGLGGVGGQPRVCKPAPALAPGETLMITTVMMGIAKMAAAPRFPSSSLLLGLPAFLTVRLSRRLEVSGKCPGTPSGSENDPGSAPGPLLERKMIARGPQNRTSGMPQLASARHGVPIPRFPSQGVGALGGAQKIMLLVIGYWLRVYWLRVCIVM